MVESYVESVQCSKISYCRTSMHARIGRNNIRSIYSNSYLLYVYSYAVVILNIVGVLVFLSARSNIFWAARASLTQKSQKSRSKSPKAAQKSALSFRMAPHDSLLHGIKLKVNSFESHFPSILDVLIFCLSTPPYNGYRIVKILPKNFYNCEIRVFLL